jgi:tetratricopeptide (TPR) repeat protein
VVLEDGLALWPDDEALRFNLALSFAAQGKTESAVLAFEECLRRSPYSVLTWRALGDTLYDAGARGRAIVAYTRSMTLEDEPGRSGEIARRLWEMILDGVPETAGSGAPPQRIRLPRGPTGSSEDDSSAEAVAVSVVGALRYDEAWRAKSDASFFAYALDTVLDVVSAIHSEPQRGGFWGPFVLSYFDDMRAAGHMEALAYDIRCAAGDADAEHWRLEHATEVRRFRERSARWAVDWLSTGIER